MDPSRSVPIPRQQSQQQGRFGYNFPFPYPRPRSSASKPNPGNSYNEGYDENSANYYPSPASQNSSLFKLANYSPETYENNFRNLNRSQPSSLDNSINSTPNRSYFNPANQSKSGSYDMAYNDWPNNSYDQTRFSERNASFNASVQDSDSSYATCSDGSFANASFEFPYSEGKLSNKGYGMNSRDTPRVATFKSISKGAYSKSKPKFGEQGTRNQNQEKMNLKRPWKGKMQQPMKKAKPSQVASVRCDICEMDFTSKVPYDMHIQGARHAKKLKAIDILRVFQSQGVAEPTDTDTKIFHCDACDMSLNGVLQLQTHFEGTKHKQKTQPKPETTEEITETATENGKQSLDKTQKPTEKATEVPVVSTTESTEGAPANKTQTLACDICNIIVNSSAQLQQHLDSKKHKAKVEGKPLPKKPWGRFKKDKKESSEEAPNIDIPDINSSFIKAETTETKT